MVWAALLYAIVGTWLTDKIGRPLVGAQLRPAALRGRLPLRPGALPREHRGRGALPRRERTSCAALRDRFANVVRNWWGIMRRQKRLTSFTAGYNQVAIIFPFVVAAPRYFRGEFALGGLMQTASAFGQVQDALSYMVSAYTDIAEWRAVVARLGGFDRALDHVRTEAAVQGIRPRGRRRGRARSGARAPGAPGRPAPRRGRLLRAPPGRDRADQRAVGRRQEHAVPRHRGHLALRPRAGDPARGRAGPLPAAEALPATGHRTRDRELSRRRRTVSRTRR